MCFGVVYFRNVLFYSDPMKTSFALDERYKNQQGSEGVPSGDGTSVDIELEKRVDTIMPPLYKVILHNDDYTPMDFVLTILETLFQKDRQTAYDLMMTVHTKGVAVCGVYPFEIAETKVARVLELARENEHPLQCTLEKA